MTRVCFILEVIRRKEKIAARFYESGAASFPYEEFAVSFPGIDHHCDEIITLLNQSNQIGSSNSTLSAQLKRLGAFLYAEILPQAIRTQLKECRNENLLILIDEYFIKVPWELLHDGDAFLCLRFNLGRSVKISGNTNAPQEREYTFPLKMLVIADPTGDLNSSREEAKAIQQEFDHKNRLVRVSCKVKNVAIEYVQKNVHGYDLLHYAGHTHYDFDRPSQSGWKMSDGLLTAQEIVKLGKVLAFPSFVFLNSCQSAHAKEWKSEKGGEDPLFGLVNAFLLCGVKHFIGPLWEIPDEGGLRFAKKFYQEISKGQTVGCAIRQARLKAIEDFGTDKMVWASYILYGNPSFYLWPSRIKTIATWVKKRMTPPVIAALSILCVLIAGAGIYSVLKARLPTMNPRAYQELKKTDVLFARGNFTAAAQFSRNALRYDPGYADAYQRLAQAQVRLGQTDPAIENLVKARNILKGKHSRAKQSAQVNTELAKLFLVKGHYSSAIDRLHDVLSYERSKNNPERLYKVYHLLGDSHATAMSYDEAIRDYQMAAKAASDLGNKDYRLHVNLLLAESFKEKLFFVLLFGQDQSKVADDLYRLENLYRQLLKESEIMQGDHQRRIKLFALSGLAQIAQMSGNRKAAILGYEESLSLLEKSQDPMALVSWEGLHWYIDLANFYLDDLNFAKMIASLERIKPQLVSLRDDNVSGFQNGLPVFKKNLQLVLDHLEQKGYLNSDFYRKVERLDQEFMKLINH